MRNFRELLVWQKGMEIAEEAYRITQRLPKEERYNLVSQMNRAAVSIPSNIAEGCSRISDPAFVQFLEYAIGSVFELDTQLILIDRLKLMPIEEMKQIRTLIEEEGKMLNGLISSMRQST